MSLETEVQNLTTQTTALLNAVNTSKSTLDNRRDAAAASADAAAVSETNAASSAAAAATSESNAAASANAAASSASAAAESASNAGTSASQAATSATNAASSATSAATSATTATNAASAATAASAAINVTANVSAWVSGTTYAVGTVVYSPMNWQNYRRKVAGAGTTDPSQDPANWEAVGFGPVNIGTAPNQVPLNGYLGTMAYQDRDGVNIGGGVVTAQIRRRAPVTKTANFTVADTEHWIICNGTGTITVTLPDAGTNVGREIMLKTIAAQSVVSASSNVVPLTGGVAGTAILPAVAGKFATLVSDGTNWVIMQAN